MADDATRLKPGDLLDHRYEVVRPLAEGGMAAIYLVRHQGLQSLHALKVPDPILFHSPEARHRFTTEGRIQALLRHPHIAQVTDIVVSPVPGLVMEYVEGGTLEELRGLLPERRLGLPLVRELFLPVLEAMQEAHSHQVVHRDLTPRNILVMKGQQGRVHPKVTDFGIAKVLQEEPDAKYRTRAGVMMGTRPYMSPEQIRGATEVDARTDIFALGAILYEAVTGRLPFDADNDFELMKRITEGTYPPPEEVLPGLPERLCQCIRKALAVDPAERFQDCAAFREALAQAVEEAPTAPVPVRAEEPPPGAKPAPPPQGPAVRRRRAALWALPPLVLVGVGLLWVHDRQTLRQLSQENARLRNGEQAQREDARRLQQDLDAAHTRVLRSETTTRNLQAELRDRLDRSEQRVRLLQDAQAQALKALERTTLETAVRFDLTGYRAFRMCNRTVERLSYQYQDDNEGSWSAPLLLEPEQCVAHWLAGYRPRVPVRFGQLNGGIPVQGEVLAGMVIGRVPDTDSEWKPWDNQLVPGPGGKGVELKSVYVETALLGGASPEP